MMLKEIKPMGLSVPDQVYDEMQSEWDAINVFCEITNDFKIESKSRQNDHITLCFEKVGHEYDIWCSIKFIIFLNVIKKIQVWSEINEVLEDFETSDPKDFKRALEILKEFLSKN